MCIRDRVLRGAEDKQYQLTAAISKDGVSETKTLDVTVKANVVLGAELVKELSLIHI